MSKGKKAKRKPAAILLPQVDSTAVQLADEDGDSKPGLRFRKKILPLGEIVYPKTARHPGGRIVMDEQYHQQLIQAFNDGAYDNPTLQWASGPQQGHNNDVKLAGGHIVGLSPARPDDPDGPGLYADVKVFGKKDAKILRRNPRVGVSPEIVQNLERVDGKRYPLAIRHILGTLNPRVRNLGPWRAVTLADDAPDLSIDLSAVKYEEITGMAKNKGKGKNKGTVQLADGDEFDAALEQALQAVELADDTGVDDGTSFLELAAQDEALRGDVDEIKLQLAESEWRGTRARYEGVIAKSVLDKVQPVFASLGDGVLEFADSDGDGTVDVRALLLEVLDEFASGNATVDLSEPGGRGDIPAAVAAGQLSEQDKANLAMLDREFGR